MGLRYLLRSSWRTLVDLLLVCTLSVNLLFAVFTVLLSSFRRGGCGPCAWSIIHERRDNLSFYPISYVNIPYLYVNSKRRIPLSTTASASSIEYTSSRTVSFLFTRRNHWLRITTYTTWLNEELDSAYEMQHRKNTRHLFLAFNNPAFSHYWAHQQQLNAHLHSHTHTHTHTPHEQQQATKQQSSNLVHLANLL